MKNALWIRALGFVCVLAVVALGCGGGEQAELEAREAAFEPIREQRAALDAKRQEIADLRAQITEVEAVAGGEDDETTEGPSVEDLQDQLEQAESESEAMSEDFMTALINLLNSADMVAGEAPTGVTLEAIRFKSAEDMLIAQEYITRGGDYRRALEILDTALMLDPDNPDLQNARAQVEIDQYMTEERFALVSEGMNESEVKDLLGTVHPNNLRDYPERNVVAWFYRREDKGAAGVYFQEKGGELQVYRLDFNAVVAPEEGAPQ